MAIKQTLIKGLGTSVFTLLFFLALPFALDFALKDLALSARVTLLLLLNPAYSLAISACVAGKSRRAWSYPLLVGLCFAVSIPILYNWTAWVYIPAYMAVGYAGIGPARLLKKKGKS